MESKNPISLSPQQTLERPIPNLIPPPEPKHSGKKIWKVLAIVLSAAVVIFIFLAWYGFHLEKQEQKSNKKSMPQEQSPSINQTYSEEQVLQMLTNDKADRGLQKKAVDYIIAHPEVVNPFYYSNVATSLFSNGNRTQGAFWFYIFQSRTGAWVAKDTDESGYPALKASLNEVLGRPINQWLGSDVNAWHDLAARAIAYEKKFPFYKGKLENLTEEEWQKLLVEKRDEYERGFTTAFAEILADGGKSTTEKRKTNGLYVGPLEELGEPLPEAWK